MAKKKNVRDKMMLHTRAARTYVDQAMGGDEVAELEAFMAIFHPEVAADRERMLPLRQDARERREKRKYR